MSLGNDASLKSVLDTFELVNSRLIDRGGSRTITPGISNQTLAKGNYKGDITIKGDSNLKEENIKSGVSIFGKNGTLVPGKKFARGSVPSKTGSKNFNYLHGGNISRDYIRIALPFTASLIVIGYQSKDNLDKYISTYDANVSPSKPIVSFTRYRDIAIISFDLYGIKGDSLVKVNNTTFDIPLINTNATVYNWIAYE